MPFFLVLLAGCVPRIASPAAAPVAPDPASASPLKVCWLEFATGTLPHGTVVAHHALAEDVPSTQSGLLLVHPTGGAWLVDGGAAAAVDAEAKDVHGFDRLLLGQAMAGWTYVRTPAQALAEVGVPTLTGALATHVHFDHLGGLVDLPGVPISVGAEDVAFPGFGYLPAEARALAGRARPVPWSDTPLWGWARTWDLFGDGSAVAVAMPGHTPGSLGVRVRLPDGRRVFLVGDTVWVKEGYEARERKGWLASSFDADPDLLDTQIAKLWALHQADPDLVILPSHDRRVWQAAFGQPGCP